MLVSLDFGTALLGSGNGGGKKLRFMIILGRHFRPAISPWHVRYESNTHRDRRVDWVGQKLPSRRWFATTSMPWIDRNFEATSPLKLWVLRPNLLLSSHRSANSLPFCQRHCNHCRTTEHEIDTDDDANRP